MVNVGDNIKSIINLTSDCSKELTDKEEIILDIDTSKICKCVYKYPNVPDDIIAIAQATSRRKFKKQEVLILALTDDKLEGEEGITFTESKIVYWDRENNGVEIEYKNIKNVDFDDMALLIEDEQERHEIMCGDESDTYRYSMHMYNMVMDIMEFK